MKSDILHAMNEIDDKYIMEAAQCLQSKKRRHTYLYRFALSAAALLIIVVIATKNQSGTGKISSDYRKHLR